MVVILVINYKYILFLGFIYLFTGCDIKPRDDGYVDFKEFSYGRPCSEVLFKCLPESEDLTWQKIPLLSGADEFELTPERISRYQYIIKGWSYNKKERIKRGYLIYGKDKKLHRRVEEKQFLIEMEESLEKEFPNFWGDIDKTIRYRWLTIAMERARKINQDPKLNNPMVELCARIGFNFYRYPKWSKILEYVKENRMNIGTASDYIDFTLFDKNESYSGNLITDWSMRGAFIILPYPKRDLVRLHDLEREAGEKGL